MGMTLPGALPLEVSFSLVFFLFWLLFVMMATRQSKMVGKAKSLGCCSFRTFFFVNCIDMDDDDLRVLAKEKNAFKWYYEHCETGFSEYKNTIPNKQTLAKLKDALMPHERSVLVLR